MDGHCQCGATRMGALVLLVIGAMLTPLAHSAILSSNPSANQNLGSDTYRFGRYHAPWTGGFLDSWGFSLGRTSRVTAHVGSLDVSIFRTKILGIDDLQVILDSRPSDPKSRSDRQWVSTVLDAGHHDLAVAGFVDGILGGKYIGKLEVSAVPIPPALLLFLSAMLSIPLMRRLRRQRAD